MNANQVFSILLTILATAWPIFSDVLLEDDWDDGDRSDTNLPEESAWFANNAAGSPTLSIIPGSLIGNIRMFETNTSSRLWITHFAPAGSPVDLAAGDTLKVTLSFRPENVPDMPSTSRGVRIGLLNFSEPGASQVSADGFSTGAGAGAPGANVTGYILNMNFAHTLIANPLQIMKRTDTATNNLMGALAVFTSLGSGGGGAEAPGFQSGVLYTLVFSITPFSTSAQLTTKLSDDAGWSISHTVTDVMSPNVRFDGFAVRPNSVADSADSLTFTQFKVEVIPYSLRITSVEFLPETGTTVTWDALIGATYQVEWRGTLEEGGFWTSLGSITAANVSESFHDPDAAFDAQRFYRVVELP